MKKILILSIVCFIFVFGSINSSFADESYFSNTEVDIHLDPNRDVNGDDNLSILTLTTEHYSVWKYGDVFFFLDIEGVDDYETTGSCFYYEIAPRFNLNKIFGLDFSTALTGDLYFATQYNDGMPAGGFDYINQVWLYGASIDFKFQPNYGFSNFSIYLRDEDTQDASYQFTFVWGQPFQAGGMDFAFNGFMDIWKDDASTTIITEPQLRLKLSSFLEKGTFLSDSSIGTEIEMSKNFFGDDTDWIINPTLFLAIPF
jgi:hypothetical protein